MPIELSGSSGITTPGLASDSMPTSGGDAVVESGSNSDGNWTRWGDGTQECYTTLYVTFTDDSVRQGYYAPHPMNYSNIPQVFGTPGGGGIVSNTNIFFARRESDYSQYGFFLKSDGGDPSTETQFPVDILTTGRWK